ALRAQNPKPKTQNPKPKTQNPKPKKFFRLQAAKNDSGCCGFSRPIRASPQAKKSGSHARRDAGQGSWYRTYLTIRGRWRFFVSKATTGGSNGRRLARGRAKRVTAGTRAREDCKEILLLTLGRRAGFCSCKTGISAIHGGRRSPASGRQRRPVQRPQ